jgi:hypothetical protein
MCAQPSYAGVGCLCMLFCQSAAERSLERQLQQPLSLLAQHRRRSGGDLPSHNLTLHGRNQHLLFLLYRSSAQSISKSINKQQHPTPTCTDSTSLGLAHMQTSLYKRLQVSRTRHASNIWKTATKQRSNGTTTQQPSRDHKARQNNNSCNSSVTLQQKQA